MIEVLILPGIILVIVWIGVYPRPFLARMEAATKGIVERMVTEASEQKDLRGVE
jgi:NADH:ubiquinone oxidoreductase subunit 4 (subunit M)